MANYKAHLFQSLGNGKLHPSRMQCGRQINRNCKGTHAVKTAHFKSLYEDDAASVCEKCLQWAKDNQKINTIMSKDELDGNLAVLEMQLNNTALLIKLQQIVANDERRGTTAKLDFPLIADGNKPHYLSIQGLIEALKITNARDNNTTP
jgi:hypothetical protein